MAHGGSPSRGCERVVRVVLPPEPGKVDRARGTNGLLPSRRAERGKLGGGRPLATDDRRSSRSLPAVPPSRPMRWRQPNLGARRRPRRRAAGRRGVDVDWLGRRSHGASRGAPRASCHASVHGDGRGGSSPRYERDGSPLHRTTNDRAQGHADRHHGAAPTPKTAPSRSPCSPRAPSTSSVGPRGRCVGALLSRERCLIFRWRAPSSRPFRRNAAVLLTLGSSRSRRRFLETPPQTSTPVRHRNASADPKDPRRSRASSSPTLRARPDSRRSLVDQRPEGPRSEGFQSTARGDRREPPDEGAARWADVRLASHRDPDQPSRASVRSTPRALRSAWSFTIPDPETGRDGRPRVIGRVAQARGYPWGTLVRLQLIGAAPQADYDRLVEIVGRFGNWPLD